MGAPYSHYVQKLKSGENIQFRPRGNSMQGKIESGQLVTISPVEPESVEKGDIVLCKVNGHYYVHLVTAVQGKRIQISNNKGHINGWVGHNGVYGKVVKVEK